MLTIRDLGRGIAELILECAYNIRKGGVGSLKLIQRKVLPVCALPANVLIDTAVQFGRDPSKISFPVLRVQRPPSMIDPKASEQPPGLVLDAFA
jgi:hypothetical protein